VWPGSTGSLLLSSTAAGGITGQVLITHQARIQGMQPWPVQIQRPLRHLERQQAAGLRNALFPDEATHIKQPGFAVLKSSSAVCAS